MRKPIIREREIRLHEGTDTWDQPWQMDRAWQLKMDGKMYSKWSHHNYKKVCDVLTKKFQLSAAKVVEGESGKLGWREDFSMWIDSNKCRHQPWVHSILCGLGQNEALIVSKAIHGGPMASPLPSS